MTFFSTSTTTRNGGNNDFHQVLMKDRSVRNSLLSLNVVTLSYQLSVFQLSVSMSVCPFFTSIFVSRVSLSIFGCPVFLECLLTSFNLLLAIYSIWMSVFLFLRTFYWYQQQTRNLGPWPFEINNFFMDLAFRESFELSQMIFLWKNFFVTPHVSSVFDRKKPIFRPFSLLLFCSIHC